MKLQQQNSEPARLRPKLGTAISRNALDYEDGRLAVSPNFKKYDDMICPEKTTPKICVQRKHLRRFPPKYVSENEATTRIHIRRIVATQEAHGADIIGRGTRLTFGACDMLISWTLFRSTQITLRMRKPFLGREER